MKETIKDFVFITFGVFGITFLHIWGILFPYYASYSYAYNSNTTVEQVYATFGFFLVGQVICSSIAPYLFIIFGIKTMYLIFALIEFFMTYFSMYQTNVISICIVLFFKGFNLQGVNTAGNLFLSEKYKEGIKKAKLLVTSRLLFSFVLMFIAQKVINPNNEPQSLKSEKGDYFFQKDVADNYYNFCIWYGTISSLSMFLPFLLIQDPKKFSNNIKKFFNYLRGLEKFDFDTNSISLSLSSLNDSNNVLDVSEKSQYYELVSNQSDKFIENDEQELQVQQKIEIFNENSLVNSVCMIILINLCTCYYNIDNYKYVSLLLGFKDNLITITFVIATGFFIFGNFIVSYIWENIGFHKATSFIIIVNCINLFFICFFDEYFIYQVLLSRFAFGYIMLYQDLFCYTLFEPLKAMKHMKKFLAFGLIGHILQIIFNFLFFSAQNYVLIYQVLLGLCILSLGIYIKQISTRKLYEDDQFNLFIIYSNIFWLLQISKQLFFLDLYTVYKLTLQELPLFFFIDYFLEL